VHAEEKAVVSSPDHIVPGRSMPQSTEKHRREKVPASLPSSPSIASERNVQIFSQPPRQTYMPSSPEIGRIHRDIGLSKILRQLKAQTFSGPYRQVRISRKISINLKCEA
jgi:hypothetical protein